jgi:hypothetical protein
VNHVAELVNNNSGIQQGQQYLIDRDGINITLGLKR